MCQTRPSLGAASLGWVTVFIGNGSKLLKNVKTSNLPVKLSQMVQSLDPFEREAKGQENTFSVKRKSSLSIVMNVLLKYTYMYIKSIYVLSLFIPTLLTMIDFEPITDRDSNQQKSNLNLHELLNTMAEGKMQHLS